MWFWVDCLGRKFNFGFDEIFLVYVFSRWGLGRRCLVYVSCFSFVLDFERSMIGLGCRVNFCGMGVGL